MHLLLYHFVKILKALKMKGLISLTFLLIQLPSLKLWDSVLGCIEEVSALFKGTIQIFNFLFSISVFFRTPINPPFVHSETNMAVAVREGYSSIVFWEELICVLIRERIAQPQSKRKKKHTRAFLIKSKFHSLKDVIDFWKFQLNYKEEITMFYLTEDPSIHPAFRATLMSLFLRWRISHIRPFWSKIRYLNLHFLYPQPVHWSRDWKVCEFISCQSSLLNTIYNAFIYFLLFSPNWRCFFPN